MRSGFLVLLALTPFTVGCPGGGVDLGSRTPGNPDDHQLVLRVYGPGSMHVGSQSKAITAERSIESSQPINWTLTGPGRLANPPGSPLPPNQGGGQDYFPPSDLSGGSAATVYFTTVDPVNGKTQKSPELTIQLLPVTSPMTMTLYSSGSGNPAEQTIVAGNDVRFDVQPTPIPAGFWGSTSVQWAIKSVLPSVPDPGSLTDASSVSPESASGRKFHAPANPPSDYDVMITATMHDPWFNLNPVVTMTVHVKKN